MSPLRFAFRQLLKNPGFTLLAVGMLVNPWNPLLYSAVLVLLGAVVVIACVIPALGAMRLKPLDVLRAE
jgi:ABC-type antimicrobial peptide transport system permease subunit